ncbi:MAG: 50S ribosomal protein L29 [Clostridia bacterium]|nr:50S ribosomal protein L29 [Clostridia bacterium]
MNIKDIRTKTTEELKTELGEKKAALLNLRFQHAINQLDNPHKIVEVKRDIAKIMTAIREKEIAEGKN